MSPGNSSLAPSCDETGQQPVITVKPEFTPKRRGQSGHLKRIRPLISTEASHQFGHHRPAACTELGSRLSGNEPGPDCRHRGRGHCPATVPRGRFGPGVVAIITLLSSFGSLSQRMIAGVLRDLFDLKVSDGQIRRLQSIGRKALQAGYNDIVADVRNSAAQSIDETG